jgi:hypothetical protein
MAHLFISKIRLPSTNGMKPDVGFMDRFMKFMLLASGFRLSR